MTSYQKLKIKCDYLQSQVDLFKKALTIHTTEPQIVEDDSKDSLSMCMRTFYAIRQNEIDERIKEELQKWVAFNLDEQSVLRLLEIKKELKK